MSYRITIKTKEQLELLQRIVDQMDLKMHYKVSEWAEYLDIIEEVNTAVHAPIEIQEFLSGDIQANPVVAAPAKKKRASSKDITKLPSLCTLHKTFTAQRAPRTDCETCWAAYKRLNPNRYAIALRKFERAKVQKANE